VAAIAPLPVSKLRKSVRLVAVRCRTMGVSIAGRERMGGQGTSASRPARRTDIREDNMDDKIDAQQSAARATGTPLVDGSPTDPTAAAHRRPR